MAMAQARDNSRQCDINRRCTLARALKATARLLERGFQGCLDAVKPLTVRFPGPGLERFDPLLRDFHAPLFLAQKLDAGRLDGRRIGGPRKSLQCCGLERIEIAQRGFQRVGGVHRELFAPGLQEAAAAAGWRFLTASSWRLSSSRTRSMIASNVSGSWMASSERLLRSRPILASFSPWIKRLYFSPRISAAALQRVINSLRNARFLARRSRKANMPARRRVSLADLR